jgi:mannose/fructose-specific phosphotransferase system component IIA
MPQNGYNYIAFFCIILLSEISSEPVATAERKRVVAALNAPVVINLLFCAAISSKTALLVRKSHLGLASNHEILFNLHSSSSQKSKREQVD